MDAMTAIVLIVPVVLFFGLVGFALYRKGDVKAGASVGQSSFFIEVRDKKESAERRQEVKRITQDVCTIDR